LTFKLTGRRIGFVTTTIELADLPGRPCPIAAGLELVGERWSLLVVRELTLGAHRFGEIVAGTGAPRDRVAARLRTLEEHGVVERRRYQTGPDRFEYHLTEAGRDLSPVLRALLVWGRTHVAATSEETR
jgi:DNA-binding HxlR family transcriptional regulator